MKQYIKDSEVKYASEIHPIVDGKRLTNPSHKQILADGWKVYTPKPYVPPIRLEPDEWEIKEAFATRIRKREAKAIMAELNTLSDNDALEVKALFTPWAKKIGEKVVAKEKLYYNDKLFRVMQPHTVQKQFPPSEATASLYEEINETNEGSKSDPIPYSGNMRLELGKYYSQDGKTYECVRDTGNPVYEPLSKLEEYGFVKSV